jgi:hypothetical protein
MASLFFWQEFTRDSKSLVNGRMYSTPLHSKRKNSKQKSARSSNGDNS